MSQNPISSTDSSSKTSGIKAVVTAKCPRCRRGNIFRGNAYDLFKKVNGELKLSTQTTLAVCPHCAQRYEVEPGYFYAAMYVSYALTVGQSLVTAFLVYFITGKLESPWPYIISIVVVIFALSPLNYRYSRVMLLHWLSPRIKYDPNLDTD